MSWEDYLNERLDPNLRKETKKLITSQFSQQLEKFILYRDQLWIGANLVSLENRTPEFVESAVKALDNLKNTIDMVIAPDRTEIIVARDAFPQQ